VLVVKSEGQGKLGTRWRKWEDVTKLFVDQETRNEGSSKFIRFRKKKYCFPQKNETAWPAMLLPTSQKKNTLLLHGSSP